MFLGRSRIERYILKITEALKVNEKKDQDLE